jgi:hypothetical protein
VSFVTPVSLAVFFDVSTDDGVDVGVEPPDVEVAGAVVAPPPAVVAEDPGVPDELLELLPQAAATRPTVHHNTADFIRMISELPSFRSS